MTLFILIAGGCVLFMLAGAGLLHLLPRAGGAGRRISTALAQAPGLDAVITYFLIAPPVIGAVLDGWLGLLAGVVGQIVGLHIWIALHELAHREARQGPRIVKVLNRLVGRWRNHAALWVTAIVLPMFWIVRVTQYLVYPPLTWLVRLPRYRSADWVNVSRHKFEGLIGHDLIWCLYCDWMTGVWSLGSEMLRNVESFWCPIRFANDKKCANCQIDFPDLKATAQSLGWVPPDGSMADVASLLETQYQQTGPNRWFGHPARLTVHGKDLPTNQPPSDENA